MAGNLENSAVAMGLEKVSFHSNPKERQCQGLLKLLHNCTHLIWQQSNAQNSPSQASTVHELRNSRCSSWLQERQRKQRSSFQHPLDHQKSKRPKDCSIHLCLFCCLMYRVIVTIFLNSIYMRQYTILVFFFLAYFTLYNRLQFHPPHQN